ncbi:MAG: hypothetical protein LC541_20445 [Candidatus Thiodiazotropha sp.]|nr:hypothetical protein [Candidatus Thiodiazotropha sp.]
MNIMSLRNPDIALFIDRETAEGWSGWQVIERWHRLYQGSLFSQRYLKGESLSSIEQQVLD